MAIALIITTCRSRLISTWAWHTCNSHQLLAQADTNIAIVILLLKHAAICIIICTSMCAYHMLQLVPVRQVAYLSVCSHLSCPSVDIPYCVLNWAHASVKAYSVVCHYNGMRVCRGCFIERHTWHGNDLAIYWTRQWLRHRHEICILAQAWTYCCQGTRSARSRQSYVTVDVSLRCLCTYLDDGIL